MVTDHKNLIENFKAVSAVPRGSGFNEKISGFLCDFAKENGLEYIQDEALNVIIKRPGSKGYENASPVVLQGHMDMVCVADPGVSHNFETEGISLVYEGDWVRANGTTLGGDDGFALAAGMSLLTDKDLVTPPLICVFTTDEETGMDGAKALDPKVFEGVKYLINLDSENENECLCGCAGGLRIDGRVPVARQWVKGDILHISLTGLRGGHSGAEIHKGITNAVRLLARVLFELKSIAGFCVVNMQGGEKDNAIPSSAEATIVLDDCFDIAKIKEYIKNIETKYRRAEENISFDLELMDACETTACTKDSFDRVLYVLLTAPNGVQAMSPSVEGLVETSLNLGIFALKDNEACFNYSLRSSCIGEKEFLSQRVRLILENAGGTGAEKNAYPAWEYRTDSVLRDKYVAKFKEVSGCEPKVNAIHAGVECGLFAEKCPSLDMISIGPDMKDIHSPRERLDLASSVRLYKVIEAVLAELK